MNRAQCTDVVRPSVIVPGTSGGFVRALLHLPAKAVDTLLAWQERAAERAHLRSLDDRMLRDMGLSRADVERESSIPFWRGA
ncbi:MAG: DUF1127 domain-containing protein [Kiloniellaceae bacterium]